MSLTRSPPIQASQVSALNAPPLLAPTPTIGPSRTVLGALVAMVLVLHALLLWGGDAVFGSSGTGTTPLSPPSGAVLNTRRIEAPVRVAAAAPAKPQTAAPRPTAARRPRVAAPPAANPGAPGVTTPALEAPALTSTSSSDAPVSPAGDSAPEGPSNESQAPFITGPQGSVPAQDSTASPPPEQRPTAIKVPPPIRLSYDVRAEVKRLPYQANGEMRWRHDGQQYEAQASIRLFLIGSRSQSSQGSLTPTGLAPRRFGDKVRNEQAAHFNAEQGKVSFSANTPDAVLLPGMQDRLSVFMQLASLVAADPAQYPAGTRISVPTVGPRDAETWVFAVDGPEDLPLSQGPMSTLKLTRAPRAEFDTRVELWLAPDIHYLPARIRITQANGDFVDQQLSGVGQP